MGLFGRDDDDRDQQQQQQQQAPQGLSQGIPMQREVYQQQTYQQGSTSGLPPHALERLREMRPDQPGALFTSDLSVDELLLVREAGFEPLGLVVGSSIYHIGMQNSNWGQNQELGVLTAAMYHARELAMTRLDEESDALGADGVVGVRLDIGRYEWGSDLAEFIAIGTAVRARDGRSWRNAQGRPFTSDLSGQDFWKLRHAGFMPAGLVMGSCVYHVAHQGFRQMLRNIGQNVEMENYTQALYDARELAMERMQSEARSLGARGIIGTRLVEQSHGWGSHVIEFFSIGTAVTELSAEHEVPSPTLTVGLNSVYNTRGFGMYGAYGGMSMR
jgi:uncharacterized protein YbjQ (UPF0145 family)